MLRIVCLLILVSACNRPQNMFRQLSASHTGITFNNEVIENDSVNPLDLEFLYNGGGVAVGDFNNDSLPDLYFTASTTSNKLYLNKGGFEFEDITARAQTTGEGIKKTEKIVSTLMISLVRCADMLK